MSDFGAFAQDSFDRKAWINRALENGSTDESDEAYLSSLALKLQLLSQDMHDSIQDSMSQLISGLPRTARELERVSGESEGIQRSLASLESRIGSVEANTHSSLGTLQALHRVKSRMGSVRACLREAANWSRLVREADAVFASNDVAAIARHLASMRHSVRVLAATPGHDARAGTFSQLYERLEDALRGPLRVAVAASDPAAARPFAHAYAQLGRLDRLVQRAARLRAEQLLANWDSFHHDQRLGAWFRAFSEGFCRALWQETEFFRAMFAAAADGDSSGQRTDDAAAAALVRPERCTAAVAHEAILPLVGALPRRLDASPSMEALEEVARAVAAFAEGVLDAVGTHDARDGLWLLADCGVLLASHAGRVGRSEAAHLKQRVENMALGYRPPEGEPAAPGGRESAGAGIGEGESGSAGAAQERATDEDGNDKEDEDEDEDDFFDSVADEVAPSRGGAPSSSSSAAQPSAAVHASPHAAAASAVRATAEGWEACVPDLFQACSAAARRCVLLTGASASSAVLEAISAALCRFAQRMQATLPAMRRAVGLSPTATQYRTAYESGEETGTAPPPDDGWPAVAAMLCAVRACSALATRLPTAEGALRRQLAEPLTAALGPSHKPRATAAPALLARARPLLARGVGCALLAVRCGVEGRIVPSPVAGEDEARRRLAAGEGPGGNVEGGDEVSGEGGRTAEHDGWGTAGNGEEEEDEEDGASAPNSVREALREAHSPCSAAEQRQLQQLAALLSDSRHELLPAAAKAAGAAAQEARQAALDAALVPVRVRLDPLPLDDDWVAEGRGADAEAPLPSESVSQAGEHVLTFVQRLEPFAAEAGPEETHALAVGLPPLADGPWASVAERLRSPSLPHTLSLTQDDDEEEEEDDEGEEEDGGEGGEDLGSVFCRHWVSALGHATAGLFLLRALQVPALTARGARQLAADADYLLSVQRAVGMVPAEALIEARAALVEPEEQLSSLSASDERWQARLRVAIARQRGIATTL